MKLTRKLEIGLNAVQVLKDKSGPTKVSDMTQAVGTTEHFLEQVMRNLRQAGIVSVKRGPGGGYILNSRSEGLTAMEVAKAVGSAPEGDTAVTSDSPVGRLNLALVQAFLKTTV